MKINRYSIGLFAVIFVLSGSVHADEVPPLPNEIRSTLEAEYPGWNLAPISKLLVPLDARDKYTNFLHVDMNGDTKADYALAVNYLDSQNNVRTTAVVFLAQKETFQEFTLHEMFLGADSRLVFAPGDTVLHWVRKGDPGYQVGEDQDSNLKQKTPVPMYATDAIEVISLGKAVVAFKFDGKGFQQIRKGAGHQDRL